MGDNAVFAAQQRRVTEQLGAAMLAAVGLMVRQYLGAPTGENEGQDSADAAWEDGAQAFRAGETVNESFDMARYLRLRQGASAAEPEESEGRADAEDRSRSVRRTAEKTTSARTAAGDAGARGSGNGAHPPPRRRAAREGMTRRRHSFRRRAETPSAPRGA